MAGEEEDVPQMDDMSVGLQMQQFLDEWHYRVLHAGVAMQWDRHQAVVAALELFEAHGVPFTLEEKQKLAVMEEEKMIEAVVRKMGLEHRKAFEHFCLQLQLIVSTATRVRLALEEGPPNEVSRIVDEGDTGITQQILKQTVVEAAVEVAELREIHTSWAKSMTKRLERLSELAMTTDICRADLEKTQQEILAFGGAQNKKARSVLVQIVCENERMLLKSVVSSWFAHCIRHRSEKHIHDFYENELDQAKTRLFKFKQDNLTHVRKALVRSAEEAEVVLKSETIRLWYREVKEGKREADMKKKLTAQQDRLDNLRSYQRGSARRSLVRLASGREETMKGMCFQGWGKHMEELKKERAVEEQVKQMQGQLEAMKQKQLSEPKGVLARFTSSSDTGIMYSTFKAWMEDVMVNRDARIMEETINGQSEKFKSLNARQKDNFKSAAQNAIELEEHCMMMRCFMDWQTEAKLGRVIRHYGVKLDSKKQQLEAVQHMFKSFAMQLEQGISNTPRSTRKAHRSQSRSHHGEATKPPALPAGGQ